MPSVNALLADDATSHAIDLQQYSTGVVRKIIGILNRVDADLADELAKALERLPRESFTVERLEKLLGAVRRLNLAAYKEANKELTATLRDFAEYEANYQYQLFAHVIPAPVQSAFRIASVSADRVYAAALSRPFQGRLLKDWAKKVEADRLTVVRNAVRIGYIEGKTTAEIVRSIKGTKANQYADGVLNRSRREIETVVRAAISHTAAVARNNFIAANSDIIAQVVWHSTLDSKTSPPCIARDGKKYEAVSHKPVGHKMPWGDGPGKFHFGCRSVELPVTKSWRELGFDVDELSPATRASMDGQVPAETQYGDWLQRQSAYRQDQVVGPTRAKLMRDGDLAFDSLYSARGEWLTLEDLRSRDAGAFERAGL